MCNNYSDIRNRSKAYSGRRNIIKIVANDEITTYFLDSKMLIILYRERSSALLCGMTRFRSNAIILESHSHYSHNITHSVLINELSRELHRQSVTLFDSGISRNRITLNVVRLIRNKDKVTLHIPDISGISREAFAIERHFTTKTHYFITHSLCNIIVNLMQFVSMTTIISEWRVPFSLRYFIFLEHSSTIFGFLHRPFIIVSFVSHPLCEVHIIDYVFHLSTR